MLPKLKQLGATVSRDVDDIGVCMTLKPALQVEAADGNPERVHASFYFEPARAPFRRPSDASENVSEDLSTLRLCDFARDQKAASAMITPVEILAAAAQGKKVHPPGQHILPRRSRARGRVPQET